MPRAATALVFIVVAPFFARADGKTPTFADDVLPILRQSCLGCHSDDKQKGGLNLATFAMAMQGGASGVVITAGDPDKSRLYTLSNHSEEPKMPPKAEKISAASLATLKLWIEQGARETSGSKVSVVKPKVDIGLKSVAKGRPAGPPPMPGKLTTEPAPRARRAGAVLALAASPWAPLVAVGGQKQILLYNTDSSDLVGVLPFEHGQINALKFSRSGAMLLAAGGRGGQIGKAVLFDIATGAKITEVGTETDAILAADVSADQTQIAVGGPSKTVRIYSTADGSVLREIKKHTDWVTAVEFSPDGVLLATGDRNGGLFVWEAFTGREFFGLRGHTAMIADVAWRDDSNVLASGSEDATVRLWEMADGKQIKSWNAHGGGVESVKFAHDGRLVSTGRDKVTKLWDANGAQQKTFEAFADIGLRTAITHDGAKVLAGDWNGTLKAWTTADAKLVAILDANPPTAADRIAMAEQAIVAAEAKVVLATTAAATSKATAEKASAELVPFQKAVTDGINAANTATAAVGPAKANVDQQTDAVAAAQVVEAARIVSQQALQEAAAKVQAAAAAAPQNAELKAQAAKVAEIAKAAAGEVEAAKKQVAAAGVAQKAAAEAFASSQKVAGEAAITVTAAQAKLTAEQAARKPVLNACAAAQAAVTGATAEVAAAKAVLAKLKPAVAKP